MAAQHTQFAKLKNFDIGLVRGCLFAFFRQPRFQSSELLFNLLLLLGCDTCPGLAFCLSGTSTTTIFFVCHLYHLLSPLRRSLTAANTSIGKILWQKVQLNFFFVLLNYLPLDSRSRIK